MGISIILMGLRGYCEIKMGFKEAGLYLLFLS